MFRHRFQHAEVVPVAPVPAFDGAARQAQRRKRDHPRRIEELAVAESVAGRTGPDRRIEREQTRLEFGQRVVADRAGELGIEEMFFRAAVAAHLECDGAAFGQTQRILETLRQALLHVGARAQPVDHHVDVVLLGLLELGQVAVLEGLAVDPETHIARSLHLGEQVEKLALLLACHGRKDHQTCRFGLGARSGGTRQREHCIDHLAHGLRLQRQVVIGAERRAGARVQQAQVVVDLGHRADSRTRVVAGRLLLDADGRRQPFDHVDVGLVHQLQELPRIGREAFDVAALALGIERVEGEARLARTRQPGDHHQLVARDVEVDVLQIVCARATNADALLREHGAEVGIVGGRIHGSVVTGQPNMISPLRIQGTPGGWRCGSVRPAAGSPAPAATVGACRGSSASSCAPTGAEEPIEFATMCSASVS